MAFLRRILALFGLLALAFSIFLPFGEFPDEPDHYDYVWYLKTRRRLPFQATDPALNPVKEGHHPPGYYALVALLTGWAPYQPHPLYVNPYLPQGRDDPHIVQQLLHPAGERFPWQGAIFATHVARLVSIGLGIVAIWATFQAGRQMAPDEPPVAWFAAGIHAFVPQFVFISAGINNDNAAALVGSLVTWQMLRLLRRPARGGFALLGLLMGVGVLSKVSLLAMLPAIGWTAWCGARAEAGARDKVKEIIVKGGLVILPMLLLSGWWMWRNLRLYDDPLGWNIWMATNTPSTRRLPITVAYVFQFWWRQFRSFWGVFGWGRIFFPPWVYLSLALLTLLGALGLVRRLARGRASASPLGRRVVLLLLVLSGFLLSTWRLGFSLDAVASQGRFLFPALTAVSVLLAIGWLAWWPRPRWGSVGRWGIGGLFALTGAALLFRLIPAYTRPLLSELPAGVRPVQGAFGGLWELVGWQAPRPQAGETWTVRLYWRARRELAPEERQLAPVRFAHLVDDEGDAIAKRDGVPTRGRFPPPAWGPDAVVVDSVRLAIPEQAQARLARLYVGFYYKQEGSDRAERVTVRSTTHPTLPGTLVLGPLVVRPPEPPKFAPQYPAGATFGPIRLLGFDLDSASVEGKEALRLVLYWRAEAEVEADYTVFVHLVGAGGLVAQGDGPPCGGGCPTWLWQAGDVWRDEHLVPLDSLPAQEAPYALSVGWYEPGSGDRLPAFSAQGERYPEDRRVLCTFSRWPEGTCR